MGWLSKSIPRQTSRLRWEPGHGSVTDSVHVTETPRKLPANDVFRIRLQLRQVLSDNGYTNEQAFCLGKSNLVR